MKEIGIVRKLDDLGRLVIPKEIRKLYKMKEGDAIEIYIDEENICIKKFDETSSILQEIEIICRLLKEAYENTVFFTSEKYLNRNKLKIENTLLEKTIVHRNMYFDQKKVFINDDKRYSGYISPINKDGVYYGSIVVVFDKKEYKEEQLQCLRMFTLFLSNLQDE